jgi:hypothetical protein
MDNNARILSSKIDFLLFLNYPNPMEKQIKRILKSIKAKELELEEFVDAANLQINAILDDELQQIYDNCFMTGQPPDIKYSYYDDSSHVECVLCKCYYKYNIGCGGYYSTIICPDCFEQRLINVIERNIIRCDKYILIREILGVDVASIIASLAQYSPGVISQED